MELSSFIGKNNDEIENAHGFTHYVETRDDFEIKKKPNQKALVEALFKYAGDQKLKAVKMNNGTILEIFDISIEDAKKNFLLLAKNKGMFYDEDAYINYSILGEDFYAFVHFVLMFSASAENVELMARILDERSIEYHMPYALDDFKEFIESHIQHQQKKPGRNEPCPCGSGKKYKKCCWIKELNGIKNKRDNFWSEGEFSETMTGEEAKKKMKTFHKGHDEDMNFNCEKCKKKISAHNKDWHGGMCDECFGKECN